MEQKSAEIPNAFMAGEEVDDLQVYAHLLVPEFPIICNSEKSRGESYLLQIRT